MTQIDLARKAGVSQTTISDIERGRNHGSTEITAIAAALGVNALWLADGKGPQYPGDAPNTVAFGQLHQVPLVSWVRAGDWTDVNDALADERKTIATTYRARARTFALIVEGQSMEPKFPAGCTIIIEPDEDPKNGSYIVVRQNGDSEATFKQLVIEGNRKYLKALNPEWPKRIMEMMPDAVVIGVVKRIEMEV